jgi:2'-5' RNA ligase
MKRTFIGVRIDQEEELRNALSSLRSELSKENIKWADINNMHITLAFLGDTDEALIKKVAIMLNEKSSLIGNIRFSLAGFGLFKSLSDPRIIWTGIQDPESLIEAHKIIKAGLEKLDIKLE